MTPIAGGGPEALADRPRGPAGCGTVCRPRSAIRSSLLALEEPELSPRELAMSITDERRYFVSEATVLLKAQDLITSLGMIVRFGLGGRDTQSAGVSPDSRSS